MALRQVLAPFEREVAGPAQEVDPHGLTERLRTDASAPDRRVSTPPRPDIFDGHQDGFASHLLAVLGRFLEFDTGGFQHRPQLQVPLVVL